MKETVSQQRWGLALPTTLQPVWRPREAGFSLGRGTGLCLGLGLGLNFSPAPLLQALVWTPRNLCLCGCPELSQGP